MPTLETATMVRQKDMRLQAAMHGLLHRLRRFARAMPMNPTADLPAHDIVWVTEIERSPNATIIEMIKANPELWAEALPQECCIVHRETLKKYVGADATEYMESHGANAVASHAARVLHEMEARERHERYSQRESN
jgi:hypothetical protein